MRIGLVLLILSGFLMATNVSYSANKRKCPAVSKNEKANKKRAGQWFKRGQRLTKEMRLSGALDSYLCSLKLVPHEHTVFNIAQLTKFYKDKTKARNKLKRFLRKYPDSPVAEDVQALLDELAIEAGEEPTPVEEPKPEPEPAPPPVPVVQVEEESKLQLNLRVLSFVSFGTAGASLILGLVFQGVSTGAKKDSQLNNISYDQRNEFEDKRRKFQISAGVMYGLTAVFSVTGAILLFKDLDNRQSERKTARGSRLILRPALTGLVLEGSF